MYSYSDLALSKYTAFSNYPSPWPIVSRKWSFPGMILPGLKSPNSDQESNAFQPVLFFWDRVFEKEVLRECGCDTAGDQGARD